MSRKKRLQKKAEKGKKSEQKKQAYAARVAAKSKKRKKVKLTSNEGRVYIKSTFNNTVITVTDTQGNTIAWGSAGHAGFRGSKKSTPYAASLAAKAVASRAVDMGISRANVFVRGVGSGRDSAIRSLDSAGLSIQAIKDVTPLPHNGPRPRKPRRV
jgi:small subunit ribosomal protein S11